MPQLAQIQKEYKEKPVQLLSVNAINREGKVASDKEHFNITYPVLLGRGTRVILDYNLVSLPKIVIIDQTGNVVFSQSRASKKKMNEIVDNLLQSLGGDKQAEEKKKNN